MPSKNISKKGENNLLRDLEETVNVFSSDEETQTFRNSNELRTKKSKICKKKIKSETLLLILTMAGVVLGMVLGVSLRHAKPSSDVIALISFPGELFMRLLKMLIVPFLFTSTVVGLATLDYRKSGKIWIHCFSYYIVTTVLAALLGIALVSAIQPGNPRLKKSDLGFLNKGLTRRVPSTMDSLFDLLRNIFPDNLIAACFQVVQTKSTQINEIVSIPSNYSFNSTSLEALNKTQNVTKVAKSLVHVYSTNILGLLFFAIIFGVTISKLGKEVKVLSDFLICLNKVLMEILTKMFWISPLGICSLIAGNLLKMKSIMLIINAIGLYIATVLSGLFIHLLITIPIIYFVITRKNPYKFYFGIFPAALTGFGLSSSAGALPITIRCVEEKLGVDSRVSRFVLPIGATMNMDGTALMESVAAIMIAQMYNVELTAGMVVAISISTTLTSIGAASIPSAGLVALLIVLDAVGLPQEPVGLLWTIDWFLDRFRTAINICGDAMGAGVINHLNRDALKKGLNINLKTNAEKPSIFLKELEQFCDNEASARPRTSQENSF